MPLGTPYITPSMLIAAPTGAPWNIVPWSKATAPEKLAEQTNVCWRATSVVDTYVNQELRATVGVEQLYGPRNSRVGVQRGTGNGLLVMRRWPVTQVLAIQVSPNQCWPRQWSTVPSDRYEIEHPLINTLSDTASATGPDGGTSIVIAPGQLGMGASNGYGWGYGAGGLAFQVSYVNGWPHTSLTEPAEEGATTISVDDVTGWTGASGFVYDGAETETVSGLSVSATNPLVLPNDVGTAQSGPGTVTLSSPLANAHAVGVVVSALPANVLWAVALAATSQVLESGMTSISAQSLSGSMSTGGKGVADLVAQYKALLDPFKRIV
jgi:hypothetical protein